MFKKCNLIAKGDGPGAFYAHVFFEKANPAHQVTIETTMEEYKALATGGSPKTEDGWQWMFSFSDNRYDTPSGRLQEEFFCKDGEEFIVMQNGEVKVVKETEDSPLANELKNIE